MLLSPFLSLVLISLLYFRDGSFDFLINIDLLNSFIDDSIFIDMDDDSLILSRGTLFIIGLLRVDKLEYLFELCVLLMDSFNQRFPFSFITLNVFLVLMNSVLILLKSLFISRLKYFQFMDDVFKLLFELSIILLQVTIILLWFDIFLYNLLNLNKSFHHTLNLHWTININWLNFYFFFNYFSLC